MSAPTDPALSPHTWSAYEPLPGGLERLLADHLTFTQLLAQAPRLAELAPLAQWREDPYPEAVLAAPGMVFGHLPRLDMTGKLDIG